MDTETKQDEKIATAPITDVSDLILLVARQAWFDFTMAQDVDMMLLL